MPCIRAFPPRAQVSRPDSLAQGSRRAAGGGGGEPCSAPQPDRAGRYPNTLSADSKRALGCKAWVTSPSQTGVTSPANRQTEVLRGSCHLPPSYKDRPQAFEEQNPSPRPSSEPWPVPSEVGPVEAAGAWCPGRIPGPHPSGLCPLEASRLPPLPCPYILPSALSSSMPATPLTPLSIFPGAPS